ncbi:sugar ABC transporter ATP-binding protein [Acidisoma cellulosilytica]|uniref:Autoinducer 2 import ATP-binding protein LsrA n=1 Tax=Acidisoma cellulosilyticum TaxID=2802395 RepID=A0A964E6G8_9PROT|nr:sugar ABC transporter ATP-binding protein [Acidisoma cellulosilyticum]MCB8883574.1 sugar ABC transporter ATP-binding protein [Acidisoma cellulosilyticum]
MTAASLSHKPATPVLAARDLSKRYGGIMALQSVGLDLGAGEIHGLCGENGAGKSTFIKILGGLVRPDSGEISVDGRPLALGQRTDPQLISIVHQELAIVPTLSVLDNIMLGMGGTSPFYFAHLVRTQVRQGLDEVGLAHIPLDRKASALSLAERQLVEIARGVARRARVLLLDEPTATLSDAEIKRVFDTARLLRDKGTALVFVSHRLDEVFALTDRVTVFRNGQHVLTERTSDLTSRDLVKAMIGRDLVRGTQKPLSVAADRPARLAIAGLRCGDALKPIDLALAPGEIAGVVGQLGSGADVLVEALAGLRGLVDGQIAIDGRAVVIGSVRDAMKAGIAYVPEDRAGKGIFLDAPVWMNLTASVMGRFSRGGVMQRAAERERGLELAAMFRIDPGRLGSEVATLSGGNQQKVALGKAAALTPRILILNEPTRGVDIGARSEIYATLRRLAEQGLAILFYSTDLEEVLELADRVVTIFRGEVVRSIGRDALDGGEILHDILRGRDDTIVLTQ